MSQLSFTSRFQLNRAIQPTSVVPWQMKIGKFFLMFTMAFLIGILSFFYLVEFTAIHTKGYQLRRLELTRNKLLNLRETQNTEIARMRSLVNIRESEIASRMIPARTPTFVKTDTSVARVPHEEKRP